MLVAKSIKILLLSESAESIRLWSAMLSPISDCLWSDLASIPAHEQADVIVTDGFSLDGSPVFEGDSAIIRIGSTLLADVNLRCGVESSELQLACRLLAEIVQLRRREITITALQRRFYNEACTDHLTGLSNRRAWDQALHERIGAVSDMHCLCLAIFDLDHFKQINDHFGHASGDAVLQSVAMTICDELRQGDFVARIGGDEFGLLIWVSYPEMATTVIERVRASLPDRLTKSGIHPVTVSAGLACINHSNPPTTPSVLYAQADEALRRAKKEGRNRTAWSWQ